MRLFALTLLLPACSLSSNWVVDNVGTDGASEIFSDDVGSPYVLGQHLVYTAHLDAVSKSHLDGATVVIEDASVIASGAPALDLEAREITLEADAVAVGSTTLRVEDGNGVTIESIPLEVAIPDGIQVVPRLGEVTDTPTPFGNDGVIELLQGERTQLAVHYLQGDRVLGGNNLLGIGDGAGMDVAVESVSTGDHDWMDVTPLEVGAWSLSVTVAGQLAFDVPVHVVDASSAGAVVVTDLTPGSAGKGDGGMVSGVVLDGDGGVINGMRPAWSLDGASLGGAGDIVTFTVDPEECHDLGASASLSGGSTATDSAHVCGRDFHIGTDETVIECATSPGLAGWAALGLAVAAVSRRRRV